MNLNFNRKFFTVCAGVFLAARIFAADTNAPTAITRAEVADNFLHLQEQIHATQLAINQNQQAAVDAAQSNANVLAERLKLLEQSVANQRANDTDAARRTQQLTLLMAGAFGLAGLGIMLLLVYFQWRAFTQLAQISAQQHAAIANASAVHQLAAPGRATVESSNTRLLDVVGQLERKIIDLENSSSLLAEAAGTKAVDLFAEGQQLLDANQPQKALELFDRFLSAHPDHAEALVKKAGALDKLGRLPEALDCCDRAIARNGDFALAFLLKGGVLNKLNRHEEALNCFERALLAQEKHGKVN